MIKHTFHKGERLKSRKAIESLFRHGRSYTVPPFRMIYREAEEAPYPLIMTVAVPRKNINHATDRNLIKRRTREAYRLRKNQAFSDLRSSGRKYQVVFIYQASELAEYRTIDNSIGALLHVLIKA